MIIICPHCAVSQSTNPKVQPNRCTKCGEWYRVVTDIVKHYPSDILEEPIDNPPDQGEKEK